MKERLIELLKDFSSCMNEDCSKCGTQGKCFTHREADYLLANGVIVPPCKVGDKVWFIERKYHYNFKTFKEFVVEGYVKAIKISLRPMRITVEYPDTNDDRGRCKGADWLVTSIGKTVFLTKEEAEQAWRKEDEGK